MKNVTVERMQKFVNQPDDMVDENLDGFAKCYPKIVSPTDNPRVLKYRYAPIKDKVGIISGGGSGHDPSFIGFIGKNMVDAVAIGNIFLPPTPEQCFDAIKCADSGSGVVVLYGNYQTDHGSFTKAIRMASECGISVKSVIANDDVAIADKKKRRGLAGEVLMWKVAGAAASLGMSLDDVVRVSQKAIDSTRSMGVGLSSCIIPTIGRSNYLIESGTMEIGIGHHGTSSLDTYKLTSADGIVDKLLDIILEDMPICAGEEVAVLVSGLGNTMLMEQNILFKRLYDKFQDMQIGIYWSHAGNFFTSLDMMGATITIMKLDEELKNMLSIPADSVALKTL